MTPITLNQVSTYLPALLKAGIVPYLKGSPGIGKSAIAHQVAQNFGLKVIDVRLAECDPTDLQGFPYFNQETHKASYYPLETFPTESDQLPTGYNGWLILLDEFSNAPMSVQSAAYKLILDRMVGQHKLHPRAVIIAAGNLETDNAAAQPMSSALVSRFAIFEVTLNQKDWNAWAATTGIDYRITAYMNFRPDHLYTFNPNTAEQPYACPRTWSLLDKLLKQLSVPVPDPLLMASLIGEGVAAEFSTFLHLQKDLPVFETIIKDPENCQLAKELSIRYATMGMLCQKVSKETLPQVIKFIERFTEDLQIIAMRELGQRHKQLLSEPSFSAWQTKLSKILA